MRSEQVIYSATFNPKVRYYWLMSSSLILLLSIVGIPLLFVWIPVALFFVDRYFRSISADLTRTKLIVRKGVLTRVEKTIPLTKITDLGMVQGPIMRALGLHSITVETAGQSGAGALVSLTGLVEPDDFRERVLAQREVLSDDEDGPALSPVGAVASGSEGSLAVLRQIAATLQRIEARLDAPSARSP